MRGISFEDLLDEFVVLLGKFEGDTGIIVGSIAVLAVILDIYSASPELGETHDVEGATGYSRTGIE